MPPCGSVLPICLSLRPVGSIHFSCLAAREQTSAVQIARASPPYNMKYFLFIFWHYLSILFLFFSDRSGPLRVLVPSYRSPRHCDVLTDSGVGSRTVGGRCTRHERPVLRATAGQQPSTDAHRVPHPRSALEPHLHLVRSVTSRQARSHRLN